MIQNQISISVHPERTKFRHQTREHERRVQQIMKYAAELSPVQYTTIHGGTKVVHQLKRCLAVAIHFFHIIWPWLPWPPPHPAPPFSANSETETQEHAKVQMILGSVKF